MLFFIRLFLCDLCDESAAGVLWLHRGDVGDFDFCHEFLHLFASPVFVCLFPAFQEEIYFYAVAFLEKLVYFL